MTQPVLSQLLEELRVILHAIPSINTKGYYLPILGPDDSFTTDSISGLRNFRESVSKEIEVLEQHLFKANPNPNFSTNASYFIAVWNEIISAPSPIVAIGKQFSLPVKNINNISQSGKDESGTTKVDVVADEGKIWIRVNTIKNERLMAEFREFDSYMTDSDDEAEKPEADDSHSSFPTDRDNSLLRMGRTLIGASSVTSIRPKIVLRLTRLDPAKGHDHRISQVIRDLGQLGLDVQLGERPLGRMADNDQDLSSRLYQPTNRVNLDLSVLIALVSDLTHDDLPANREEAETRFGVCTHISNGTSSKESRSQKIWSDDFGLENGVTKHSHALFLQCLQEMGHGILNGIVERLSAAYPIETLQFWTTEEARNRTLQIVEKVGGTNEKRRARIMLYSDTDENEPIPYLPSEFWKISRYPPTFLPSLLPIRIHKSGKNDEASRTTSFFQTRLIQTCRYFLRHAATPHPRLVRKYKEVDRAQVSTLNSKLTMHTVESLLIGGCEGMTTITANKTSIKTLLKEMKIMENHDTAVLDDSEIRHFQRGENVENTNCAVIWIIEPRSLAERMRADRPCLAVEEQS